MSEPKVKRDLTDTILPLQRRVEKILVYENRYDGVHIIFQDGSVLKIAFVGAPGADMNWYEWLSVNWNGQEQARV